MRFDPYRKVNFLPFARGRKGTSLFRQLHKKALRHQQSLSRRSTFVMQAQSIRGLQATRLNARYQASSTWLYLILMKLQLDKEFCLRSRFYCLVKHFDLRSTPRKKRRHVSRQTSLLARIKNVSFNPVACRHRPTCFRFSFERLELSIKLKSLLR